MLLSQIEKNTSYRVIGIEASMVNSLTEIGLYVDALVKIIHEGPVQHDPLMLLVNNKYNLAIDRNTAVHIKVVKEG